MKTISVLPNAMPEFSAITEFFSGDFEITTENFQHLTSDVIKVMTRNLRAEIKTGSEVRAKLYTNTSEFVTESGITALLFLCDTTCDIWHHNQLTMTIHTKPNYMLLVRDQITLTLNQPGEILQCYVSEGTELWQSPYHND
jgi:hypothetical protein